MQRSNGIILQLECFVFNARQKFFCIKYFTLFLLQEEKHADLLVKDIPIDGKKDIINRSGIA